METLIVLFVLAILVLLGVIIFLLLKKTLRGEKENSSFLMLQQQLNHIDQVLDSKLSESTKAIQSQFGQSMGILEKVTEKIAKLEETNKQVIGFTEQLQSFQSILANQKKRGVYGEIILENILKNVLPPALYKTQYMFKNGDKVDAVIFIEKDKIIPIDSKFSLENYNKAVKEKDPIKKEQLEKLFINDLKNRINEAAKYIRSDEGTLGYALMFIPADGIYSDLLENEVGGIQINTRDLIDYAHEKNVFLVSPNMFYAYLQTILHGLKALQIEKGALEIKKGVESLAKHLLSYNESFNKIGNYLDLSIKTYLDARHEYNKIDKDVIKITGGEFQIESKEIKEIERPRLED